MKISEIFTNNHQGLEEKVNFHAYAMGFSIFFNLYSYSIIFSVTILGVISIMEQLDLLKVAIVQHNKSLNNRSGVGARSA